MQLRVSHHLCMVLLYDMLLGRGIQCGGPVKRFLRNHKGELLTAFEKSAKRNSDSQMIGTAGIWYMYFVVLIFALCNNSSVRSNCAASCISVLSRFTRSCKRVHNIILCIIYTASGLQASEYIRYIP